MKKSYDHPLYLTRFLHGACLSGNGGKNGFTAFADTLVKSYQIKPITAGTSADTVTAYKISGTDTTTHVLTTLGSAQTAAVEVAGTFTLAKGDALHLVKGTDVTGVADYGVELALVARAAVTA